MSIPENPLNVGNTTTHRHILIAFKYAEDAFNTTDIDMKNALVGKSIRMKDRQFHEVVGAYIETQFGICGNPEIYLFCYAEGYYGYYSNRDTKHWHSDAKCMKFRIDESSYDNIEFKK